MVFFEAFVFLQIFSFKYFDYFIKFYFEINLQKHSLLLSDKKEAKLMASFLSDNNKYKQNKRGCTKIQPL
jgi:hypothetical protein